MFVFWIRKTLWHFILFLLFTTRHHPQFVLFTFFSHPYFGISSKVSTFSTQCVIYKRLNELFLNELFYKFSSSSCSDCFTYSYCFCLLAYSSTVYLLVVCICSRDSYGLRVSWGQWGGRWICPSTPLDEICFQQGKKTVLSSPQKTFRGHDCGCSTGEKLVQYSFEFFPLKLTTTSLGNIGQWKRYTEKNLA